MIIHNGHEVQELYRQGRKVKAVIRKGKRVFGIEPLDRLFFDLKIQNNLPSSMVFDGFVFSSVILKEVKVSDIVDITAEEPFKVYMYGVNINDKNYICITSAYYGTNTIMTPTHLGQYRQNFVIDFSIFDWSYCKSIGLQAFRGKMINMDKMNLSSICTGFILGEIGSLSEFYLPLSDYSGFKSLNYMFGWCTGLKYLNWSNADFRNVTNTDSAINVQTNKLERIETPAFSAQKNINLPTTFYNADGSEYGNVIPANSVGSVTIYRTRELAQQYNPELFT